MAKSGRHGRIYIDYLRNGMGATAVGAYSTRARDGAPVSVPLAWDELGANIRANHFTLLNLPNRLAYLDGDPWEGFASLKQTLPGLPGAPSKDELAAHWKKVGKKALVHLARRPLELTPQRLSSDAPKSVRRIKVGDGHRSWIDSVEGLLDLVEMGAVELSPWNATIDDIEHPDLLVFSVGTVETALRLRDLLEAEGLDSWPMLTGSKELHVMVPIEPELTWQEALRYSQQIAGRVAGGGVDCRYNAKGAAAIGAWSPRALPGFPVAAPVEWGELQKGLQPDSVTILSNARRPSPGKP
jgi:bifunctional non-homologous end joining protein LigD